MLNYSLAKPFSSALWCALLLAVLASAPARAADPCPTSADEIATDGPDVTNSSVVVPYGSLQAENGVDWAARQGSNLLDGTNTRLRLGIARCTEFLVDVPNYFLPIDGSQPSGFSDVVVSVKRQLPVPFGFDLSATAGLGFPSGSRQISGRGYEPYIQVPWSHEIADGWETDGMFTITWFPNESPRNPTFEPTFSLERAFGPWVDMFVEYVGGSIINDRVRCWIQAAPGDSRDYSRSIFTLASDSTAVRSITIFGIGYSVRFDGCLESWRDVHHEDAGRSAAG